MHSTSQSQQSARRICCGRLVATRRGCAGAATGCRQRREELVACVGDPPLPSHHSHGRAVCRLDDGADGVVGQRQDDLHVVGRAAVLELQGGGGKGAGRDRTAERIVSQVRRHVRRGRGTGERGEQEGAGSASGGGGRGASTLAQALAHAPHLRPGLDAVLGAAAVGLVHVALDPHQRLDVLHAPRTRTRDTATAWAKAMRVCQAARHPQAV